MNKSDLNKILINKRSFLRLFFFLFFDFIFIPLSVFLAFVLRFDGQIPSEHILNLFGMAVLSLIILLPAFFFFKLYSFTWVYVSATELVSLIKATTLGFVFLTAVFFLLRDNVIFLGFPRSTLFISYVLVIIFCGGMRFSKRAYIQLFKSKIGGGKERVLIVGAGTAGEQILRSIINSKDSPYNPVGFIDDSPAKKGIIIHGFKVLGKTEDISKIIKEKKVESMIVALPSEGSKAIKRAVEAGRNAGIIKIKIAPSVAEIMSGEVDYYSLREVQMEDLLGRESIKLDQDSINSFIKDKKVLVTGAAGSIGSELCRQIAKFKPAALSILDQDETGVFNMINELNDNFPELKVSSFVADICDEPRIDGIFKEIKPNAVFHAAAYKHVPLMEDHPSEAVKDNIFGTNIVASVALKNGVEKFIYISTDKAVNPTSVMGATKRMGEMICSIYNEKNGKFISVRFGNVLNSRGSVIPIFREQIKRGGPVEITHPEMKRYFITIPEACLLVLQAGAMGNGGEVFVLDMGEPVKIMDLAKELIKLSGFEPDKDIPIVFTGVRPGEKFVEELLTAEEETTSTQNKKIFMAKVSEVDKIKLEKAMKELKTIKNKEEIINILSKFVPGYSHKK